MQGKLELNSVFGVGTEVRLKIPFTKCQDTKFIEPLAQTSSFSTNENLNILLVEDNEIGSIVATTMLEQDGHTVTTAENGSDALKLLNASSFDLVFLDIQMPVMDGIAAIKEIRKNEYWKSLPVIALTANVMADEIKHYMDIGFNAHVSKPFSRQSLLGALISS